MSDRKSRRGEPLSVSIYNASDDVQTVLFNSVAYTFEPGKETEVEGQKTPPKDDFDRPTEEGVAKGLLVDNKFATAQIISDHIERVGRKLGLVRLYGDSSDDKEIKEVRSAWIKARSAESKGIEARWRQKCVEYKASGAGVPPMPEHVEKAQDFLIKYKNGYVEVHKRFVVTLDGRSFNTKEEAKKHIFARYPNESGAWATHVNDTQAVEMEEKEEKASAVSALETIAAVAKAQKEKVSA